LGASMRLADGFEDERRKLECARERAIIWRQIALDIQPDQRLWIAQRLAQRLARQIGAQLAILPGNRAARRIRPRHRSSSALPNRTAQFNRETTARQPRDNRETAA